MSPTSVLPDTYGEDGAPFRITVDEYGRITNAFPEERTAPIIESPDGTILVDQIGDTTLLSMVPNIVSPGTYGSSSAAAQVTVDTYGRVTAASTNPLPTVSSSTLTIAGGPAYTANLTSGIVTPGTYGTASLIPSITVDTYGRTTAVTTNAITLPTLASGSYTPTFTDTQGWGTPSALFGYYQRIGDIVTVYVKISTYNTTTNIHHCTLSLPILPNNNFAGTTGEVLGVCLSSPDGSGTLIVISYASTKLVQVRQTSGGNVNGGISYITFSYNINN